MTSISRNHAPALALLAAATPLPSCPGTLPTLEAVYREHSAAVARWVGRLAGPGYDVEDLVQDVFLAVEERLPTFRGESRLSTWLYGIAENVVRYQRRKQRWRRWLGLAPAVTETLRDPSPGPGEHLERRRSHALVYAALAELPEKYRNVIILFELEGLSGEEIAELTGTKLATVWTWLHRGRQRFLECLTRLAPDELEGRSVLRGSGGAVP